MLVGYLLFPIVAFVVRFAGSTDRGFHAAGLGDALRVSAESACISTLIIAALGIPLAYALARSTGAVGAVVGGIVLLPLALPPVMSGIMLIYVVGPYTTIGRFFGGHLTDSLTGVVLAQTFVAAPFLIIAARSAFATIDPALDDLAATLGHRPLARFWRVALPIAVPGIRAGLLLTFLRAVGEYGATVLLAYHPYSLPVFTYVQFSSTGIPSTQAPTALALGLAVVVILLGRLRLPPAVRSATLPEPRTPEAHEPSRVSFDLDVTVGTFHLRLAHTSTAHRIAILGPSGSGKSLTLKSLAGLLGPGVGVVRYDMELMDNVPTEARRIGYVPQGLSLFPNRTVWAQVLFAVDADPALAAWWLDTLGLTGLETRQPHQLSGGQRQRVCLAQALCRSPRLVLLDEPFSGLDAPVRSRLRQQLRRLQHDAGLSTVLVTHDPEEAALLADEILVVADGRLLQAGPRREVYRRPASPEVARLLGIDNLSAGVVAAGGVDIGGVVIDAAVDGLPAGIDVRWCVRPEQVVVTPHGRYPAQVLDVADVGASTILTLRIGRDTELRARTPGLAGVEPGESCRVDLDPAATAVWPAADGHDQDRLSPVRGGP
ncbi:MAG: ABC transporter ATP-binding protein/permease [Mycobacteriales bacterium]|nr:MAG: molybdenum ABC transporter permease [Pseudonocardiales bacterium]